MCSYHMTPLTRSIPWYHRPAAFRWLGLIVLLGVFAGANPSLAQTGGAPRRLASGDAVKVEVVGRQDLSGQFSVDSQGSILMPVLGAIRATGRTPDELATDISRRVSLIQREIPLVTVTLLETSGRRLYVLGAVIMPGVYPTGEGATVWDAISKAGGPTDDADLAAVEIISGDYKTFHAPRVVDVAAAIRGSALDSLPRLRPGDTVRVPSRTTTLASSGGGGVIYVMGAVANQGAVVYEPNVDLARLLIRAVPTPDANFESVEIVRNNGDRLMRLQVNMSKQYFGKAEAVGNPPLQAGDTIYLHRTKEGFGLFKALGLLGTVLALATSITYLSNN